jgi:iturin family lipopeptide synthetase A
MSNSPRYAALEAEVKTILQYLSGHSMTGVNTSASFFDLGFDSLLLTQASQSFRQKFGVKITFRQLMEELLSIDAVTAYLDQKVAADKFTGATPTLAAPAPVVAKPVPAAPVAVPVAPVIRATTPAASCPLGDEAQLDLTQRADRLIQQQLQIMAEQLELLRSGGAVLSVPDPIVAATNGSAAHAQPEKKTAPIAVATPAAPAPTPKYFGPYKPIDRSPSGGLSDRQQKHLDALIAAYEKKTPRSKAYTAKHRAHFADPRTVSGFRQTWKEIVYPIVVKQSAGTHLLDLDNNEYLDITLGFGTHFFGHSPEFAVRAQQWQLRKGVEVGPQSPLVGKTAELMCELTGMDRAAFCNTGSEAIVAAVRVARTVTGRVKIATMSGAYHGINDEVLVRGTMVDGKPKSIPIAPGIPQHMVDEVIVLEYGSPEALKILQEHAHELAAVLVEPVQSRQPDLAPVEFLKEVRRITEESETALIFDELVTGFRVHPGGCQALWGIKADMATYGKVIGGGMPIGALCGKAMYMDALDGGNWNYGDASFPEVGMTFFAGTFVRHQLAIRSTLSVLTYLKHHGPALQDELAMRCALLADTLNAYFTENNVPMRMTRFRSMMYFRFQEEFKFSSLLFYHLRLRGIHIWEARPVFLSTVHTDADVATIVQAFKESLEALREGGFLPEPEKVPAATLPAMAATTPAPGSYAVPPAEVQFSVYFFGNYDAAYREDKYQLLLDAARFADQNGFTAVWLPERHFHAVGGFSPNSSLLAAALARETTQLQLRGGSVVLPLHHPVRVAEEWSLVDNLSNGRVAISIATGWHPNDFVFAPEAFADRWNICAQNLAVIQQLWRGETVDLPTPGGEKLPVKLFPLPKQAELKIWATCIHKESYAEAGRKGMNVLGYLMNQTVDELGEKIAAYREARRAVGLDPATGHITTLLFTYLDDTVEKARAVARGPLCDYLRSYLDNSQKKIEKTVADMAVDQEDVDYLTNRSCDDYFNGKSLIGTPESCAVVLEKLTSIGVNEIGCFIDFGVEPAKVVRSLGIASQLLKNHRAKSAVDQTLPLTDAEQGLWYLCTRDAGAARSYQESITLSLNGPLDTAALRKALQGLVDRHEALRTTLSEDGQSQTIHAKWDFDLAEMDFSQLTPDAARTAAAEKLFELDGNSFTDLRGPFLQACLARVTPTQHLLFLAFHHLVGNGPSYWVFLNELVALYNEASAGVAANLMPAVPFSEFVQKRKAYDESEDKGDAEKFWVKQFAHGVPVLELPMDRPRPAEVAYNGDRQEIVLKPELNTALRQIGAAQASSLFMVLFAAYSVLMHRLSGQDDLVIGVPFDSFIRAEEGKRSLFANTTNMMPLRSYLESGVSFIEYLHQVKSLIIEATEHQDYFFGNLLRKLKLPRDPSRAPFFTVTFNFESGEFHRTLSGGVELAMETTGVPYRSARGAAMFDFYLNAAERVNGEIIIQADHNTDFIFSETAKRWLRHYEVLLEGVAAAPDSPIEALPLMSEEEQQSLIDSFSRPHAGLPVS